MAIRPTASSSNPVWVIAPAALAATSRPGTGLAKGDEPESMYMVTSQKDLVNGCCFDYGNAETTSNDDGNGTMEALYFGAGVVWGTGYGGKPGPWVMADLENGLYAGWENGQDKNISTNTPLKFDFVNGLRRRRHEGQEQQQGPLCALWRRCDVRYPDRPCTTEFAPKNPATSPCRNRGPSSSESAGTTAAALEDASTKAPYRPAR